MRKRDYLMKNMYVVLVLAMLLTTSCINTKRIVYLEDMREDISYPMNAQPEMRIQRDDRLSIIVNSRNPELLRHRHPEKQQRAFRGHAYGFRLPERGLVLRLRGAAQRRPRFLRRRRPRFRPRPPQIQAYPDFPKHRMGRIEKTSHNERQRKEPERNTVQALFFKIRRFPPGGAPSARPPRQSEILGR